MRRASFWAAVAGTAILSHFGLRLVAEKSPFTGLKHLAAYLASAPSTTGGN